MGAHELAVPEQSVRRSLKKSERYSGPLPSRLKDLLRQPASQIKRALSIETWLRAAGLNLGS